MQRFMILKIAFLMGVLFSTSYSADQVVSREGDIVTVIASGEYIMGDSDNRKEARTMALTQAKINASEVAGTYIESNFESVTRQMNGEIVDKVTKQELRSFSAAILQSEITNDTMEMLANKTTIYKITIKARIDLTVLRERVKQLGEDKVKKDRLISLEKENKELSFTLEKLSAQIRTLGNVKSVNPEEIKVLREERDQLFTMFEKNEGAAKLVFEKGSIQNEYQQKIIMATEIADVINNLLDNDLSKYIMVKVEKPKVISQNGKMFTLELKYSFVFNKEKLIKKLSQHSIKVNLHPFAVRYPEYEITLDGAYYDKLGIFEILEERLHKIKACAVFLLPSEKIEIPIFYQDTWNRGLTLFELSSCEHARENTLRFEISEEKLNTFTEIEIKINSKCNKSQNCSLM